MRKKLLFTVTNLNRGGAETSLINLLKQLDPSLYEIDLLIMDQHEQDGTINLIEKIPRWIRVCNAYKQFQQFSIVSRIWGKLLNTKHDTRTFYLPALEFVHYRIYDWAFHIGEWWSPEFVATKVCAIRKAAWFHADLDIQHFDEDLFFSFHEYFDKYIFVSENSKTKSSALFPFIKQKACVIHNIADIELIKSQSKELIHDNIFSTDIPAFVTCANIRPEKNHLRQIEVLRILKDRGIQLLWINIGSTANTELTLKIHDCINRYELNNSFILLGPQENPYRYMKKAKAVIVLSDSESWSMVITEALVLGVPVISTKTSGAKEQITDGETGILTDFSAEKIADTIENFLKNEELEKRIKQNIAQFDNTKEIVSTFEEFLNSPIIKENNKDKPEILFIMDDINYEGGAHDATKLLISNLADNGQFVSIFSNSLPNIQSLKTIKGSKTISWKDVTEYKIYNRRLLDCLLDHNLSYQQKRFRLKLFWDARFGNTAKAFEKSVLPKISDLFSRYQIIYVMSEDSNYRQLVAESKCKRKIQMIHTDYNAWKELNEWTKGITKNDLYIYKKFDQIIFLSESIRNSFIATYPELKSKTAVNANLIPVEKIFFEANIDKDCLKFISIGRIDQYKYKYFIPVLSRLYDEGYKFHWSIIGDGPYFSDLQKKVNKSKFNRSICFLGKQNNPYLFLKQADIFALLSEYEGLPNTIFESLILGIPVIATNVGGVRDQVIPEETGWLAENTDDGVYKTLKYILDHPTEVTDLKNKLKNYHYDNSGIMHKNYNILFGDKHLQEDMN